MKFLIELKESGSNFIPTADELIAALTLSLLARGYTIADIQIKEVNNGKENK